jgi:FkbM family methyltransferase
MDGNLVFNFWKPWYVYRPGQVVRRAVRVAFPCRNPIRLVPLPWGCHLEIDIRETIGYSIWTTGVFDLSVVEILWRLANPTKLSLDVGANLGAMTGPLALRSAEVWAFEPHPDLFRRLSKNVASFGACSGFSSCRLFEFAASDTDGTSFLLFPDGFESNNGISRLSDEDSGEGVPVRTARIDALVAKREIGMMKLDVEGHELLVLQGTAEALKHGQIDHIVFEDHVGPTSPVCQYLTECDLTILAISWRMSGPVLSPPGSLIQRRFEAPSFLATRFPREAIKRCEQSGWECLRGRV